MALASRLVSILPRSWGDVCLQEGESCLLVSLPGALPDSQAWSDPPRVRAEAGWGSSGCSARSADGRAELGLRLLPGTCCSPQGIGSNQDLKGANTSQERGQSPARFCCFSSVPMKTTAVTVRAVGSPGLSSGLPRARVSCSEALAAWHITKSPVGQREESLPSEARGEAVELFGRLVSSSQAGRGVTCSVTELWPPWARLWLLFQRLGPSLLAFLITVS